MARFSLLIHGDTAELPDLLDAIADAAFTEDFDDDIPLPDVTDDDEVPAADATSAPESDDDAE